MVAVGVAALFAFKDETERPVVSGILEGRVVRVGSRVGGRVAEVRVREGVEVEPGQTLAVLAPFDLEGGLVEAQGRVAVQEATQRKLEGGFRSEEIAQARAQRDQARAAWEEAVAGPRRQTIQEAADARELAASELELATLTHARTSELHAKRAVSQDDLDKARIQLRIAEANVNARRSALDLLREGTRPEQVAQAKARLEEAEAILSLRTKGFRTEEVDEAKAGVQAARGALAVVRARIEELTVRSPCPGRVEAMDIEPGDLVSPNAPIVSILDRRRIWVRSYAPQRYLSQVQPGRELTVRIDAFPGKDFRGRVSFLAHEAEFTPSNVQTPDQRSKQVFRFEVELDPAAGFRPGMTADVLLADAPAAP